jgi:hypothetical protein
MLRDVPINMKPDEFIKQDIQDNIKSEVKKAQFLNFSLVRATQWYERAVVISVLFVSSFLPIGLALKLCYWTTCVLSRNPRHRVAVDAVKRVRDQEG